MKSSIILCFLIVLSISQNYEQQEAWGGECQTGKRLSPINIKSTKVQGCVSDLTVTIESTNGDYVQTPYNAKNKNLLTYFNLSTINITKKGSSKTYQAIQFHLHHKSEHHLDGKPYDLELHIVHQNKDDKNLAVYSVLFEAFDDGSVSNDPFDNWHLDTDKNITQKFPVPLTTPEEVYQYKGSLTTPDCTEGVQWVVNIKAVRIKRSNVEKIGKLINEGHQNDRKIQPLNDRKIIEGGDACSLSHRNHQRSHHKLSYSS